jgi:tyrosine-specific transport protein
MHLASQTRLLRGKCRNDRAEETLPPRKPSLPLILATAGVTGGKKLQKSKDKIKKQKAALTRTALIGDFDVDSPTTVQCKPEVSSPAGGTMFGAICLITGSTVGAGILALPSVTAPSGAVPSGIGLVGTWALLTAQALLMAEVNLNLLSTKKADGNLQLVTLRQMAELTLAGGTKGWSGHAVSFLYLTLSYSLLVAYSSKLSEVIHGFLHPSFVEQLCNPSLISLLIAVATGVIFVRGGSSSADNLNQTCTGLLFLLFGCIIASSFSSGSVVNLLDSSMHRTASSSNWSSLPSALPIMFLTLVYHDLVPFVCYYLGGDRARVKSALVIGSLVPLSMVLFWNSAILMQQATVDGASWSCLADPLDAFIHSSGSFTKSAVQSFSFLAVITSYLSTVIGFTETVAKEVKRFPQFPQFLKSSFDSKPSDQLIAVTLALGPPLLWNILYPDLFIRLLSFSGGYLMVGLYGILPPCMAWVHRSSRQRHTPDLVMLPGGRPVLVSLLIASSGVAMAQLLLN